MLPALLLLALVVDVCCTVHGRTALQRRLGCRLVYREDTLGAAELLLVSKRLLRHLLCTRQYQTPHRVR
jgi:hypothetical protein